ncbi:H-NS family nucleoid-associated regulatory protein [Sinorhizobium fredii]|uniref:H-NS histone family DNA-binding protein n=1 Tax=Rhizobium fredii TaxID=380 RepID=A0A2L0H4Q8_RHIFR|nr:H-NS histone family protein [Sinorhizobium fredii]AUX76424.1 H-NS histone family DNA-binding protein [Sinorhizobium fredii]
MSNIDFSSLTIEEIDAALEELPKLRKIKVEARRAELLEELQRLGGLPKRMPVRMPPKFRDDKGNTWTGQGTTPIWIRELEEAGGSREQYRIKKKD